MTRRLAIFTTMGSRDEREEPRDQHNWRTKWLAYVCYSCNLQIWRYEKTKKKTKSLFCLELAPLFILNKLMQFKRKKNNKLLTFAFEFTQNVIRVRPTWIEVGSHMKEVLEVYFLVTSDHTLIGKWSKRRVNKTNKIG